MDVNAQDAVCVWVVDDEPVNRALARAILSRAGCRVREFESAGQVMDALSSEVPMAVVTDIRMPGISGTQLMRLMRSRPDLPSIRYVAYTAHCDPDAAGALESAGFDAVLYKPVTYSQVLQAVLGDQGEH